MRAAILYIGGKKRVGEILDNTPVFIHFISSNTIYDKIYDFGVIGDYK